MFCTNVFKNTQNNIRFTGLVNKNALKTNFYKHLKISPNQCPIYQRRKLDYTSLKMMNEIIIISEMSLAKGSKTVA